MYFVENFDTGEIEDWTEVEIRSLIMLIKANKLLIDKTDKDYWNKIKKDDAWKIIANLLNKTGMIFLLYIYAIFIKFKIIFIHNL